MLLGGGTLSGVMREWTRLASDAAAQSKRGTSGWTRTSIRTILLNPRIAGPVGLPWGDRRARRLGAAGERGDLAGGARHPGRPVPQAAARGADPAGRAGAVPVRERGHRHAVPHRAASTGAPRPPATAPGTAGMWPGRPGRSRTFIEKLVVARLSRADAADLVAVQEGGPDVAALREEAAAIRTNLEEMAADRALGLITRAQMLAATERANLRLERDRRRAGARGAGERARPAGRRRERRRRVGGPGPVPQARGDQDADDDHAALAGPGRPPRRSTPPRSQVTWRQQG